MRVFLVDFGSTFVKWLVHDIESKCDLLSGKIPFPLPIIQDDKRFVISETQIRKLIEEVFGVGLSQGCQKAYISVQMHGYLLRNSAGDTSDYVSWRDCSGEIGDEALKEITFNRRGTSLKANLPYAKLWKHRETLTGAELYTLGSYISFLLTGRNVTHKTDGCASGFYDAETLEGDCIGGLKLPILEDDIGVVGDFCGMEIYAPMGDHQISFQGSGAGTDKYLVNIGTATQISCLENSDYPAEDYEIRPYFERGMGLFTISGLIGGDKLFEGEGKEELLDEIIKAIEMLPKKSGIVFGGGGSRQVYEYMSEELGRRDISCSLININVGMEGLKWISKQAQCCQK